MRVPIYLVEKTTGLSDKNGVVLYYAVAAKLTKAAAEQLKHDYGDGTRVRKLIADK